MTTPAAEDPWAATRDASWYERPNVHSDKQVHMAGRMAPRREGVMSRCGRSILDENSSWQPETVPAWLRCRSNGCRQAWPTATEEPTR
ncbi:hypothetical protein ACFRCI_09515 [Streptomyces sp. NPDC056638]|uniref:hypothetical protein n=1 Tax=Streptomyces sp. NPDC056638 TaxID=3345887 RepID=UPI00368914E3